MQRYAQNCIVAVQLRPKLECSNKFQWQSPISYHDIITWSVARQRLDKHLSAATNKQEIIEEYLEAAFSMRSVLMLYNEDTSRVRSGWTPSVQTGSNSSTVALRVVGGDEMGTQCLGVKLGHSVPGGYKYGNLAFQDGGVSNLKQ
jgi:hypothetical protein